MTQYRTSFVPVKLSLADLAGEAYVDALCGARAALLGEDDGLAALAHEAVDFYPESLQQRLLDLMPRVGTQLVEPFTQGAAGAASSAFAANSKTALSPLSALGYLRLGEDGRLFLSSKSEHYHAPLGHSFPGYRLIDYARRLGVPNATHNNTRGHLTRLLEEELVRSAGGKLTRVFNLETGSLAAEAALKLALSRFYQAQPDSPAPKYDGRIPVLLVMGDDEGGIQANYHGTTMFTQMMRGMWPKLGASLEESQRFLVRSVRPNDYEELEAVFAEYGQTPYKIGAFFHELILMNYGGRRLEDAFVQRMYALCEAQDVVTVVDEIQTGIWSPKIYLFREYGVEPDIVVLGKGFPGGEYPASRVLFNADLDVLPQFGALVTNGQEELASMAYLITLRWAEANAEVTGAVGDYYEGRLKELATAHSDKIAAIEGRRHLAGVYFHDLDSAKGFAKQLNDGGFDISAQTYKAGCPPSALTKLPLTAGYEVVDFLLARMQDALK